MKFHRQSRTASFWEWTRRRAPGHLWSVQTNDFRLIHSFTITSFLAPEFQQKNGRRKSSSGTKHLWRKSSKMECRKLNPVNHWDICACRPSESTRSNCPTRFHVFSSSSRPWICTLHSLLPSLMRFVFCSVCILNAAGGLTLFIRIIFESPNYLKWCNTSMRQSFRQVMEPSITIPSSSLRLVWDRQSFQIPRR